MKKIELEVKILDINEWDVKRKLSELGAKELRESDFKRYVYDFSPLDLNKWIRLRTDGNKSSLTIKEISSDNIDGTRESEIEVSNFDTTHSILQELWYQHKSYQENKRKSYILDDVNIEIDSWPMIPTYLEIEWSSEKWILDIVKKLWYNINDVTSINTKKVYSHYGINLEEYKNLTFK